MEVYHWCTHVLQIMNIKNDMHRAEELINDVLCLLTSSNEK